MLQQHTKIGTISMTPAQDDHKFMNHSILKYVYVCIHTHVYVCVYICCFKYLSSVIWKPELCKAYWSMKHWCFEIAMGLLAIRVLPGIWISVISLKNIGDYFHRNPFFFFFFTHLERKSFFSLPSSPLLSQL